MPSMVWAGMPNASARPVIVPAVVSCTRIDVANWLFSQTKMSGRRRSDARLSASRSTPWLTAPSPKNVTATRSCPARRCDQAAPAAIAAEAPTMALAP